MEVRELLSGEVLTISADENVRAGAVAMKDAGFGSLAVVDNGELVGIFTERDVLEAVASGANLGEGTVGEWMTDYPDSFAPDIEVADAADWLLATGYRHLPVVQDGSLIGMVSIKDVLWAMAGVERG